MTRPSFWALEKEADERVCEKRAQRPPCEPLTAFVDATLTTAGMAALATAVQPSTGMGARLADHPA